MKPEYATGNVWSMEVRHGGAPTPSLVLGGAAARERGGRGREGLAFMLTEIHKKI